MEPGTASLSMRQLSSNIRNLGSKRSARLAPATADGANIKRVACSASKSDLV
jgi:hypothetical protein